MRKVRVYIASPYSNGDKDENTKLQATATYHLLKLGFNPYMPLYHHYIQKEYPELNDEIDWLEIDKEWLKECDLAIRLHPKDKNGNSIYSAGADEEQRFCEDNGISMLHYDSIEQMVTSMRNFRPIIYLEEEMPANK